MKFKLKLDRKQVQDFLLQNVEKIVLAAVVLLFLLMLYSSLTGAGRFEKTPEQLVEQVKRGEEEIKRTPPESPVVIPNPDYVEQAKRSRIPIKEKPYANTVVWDQPLFPRKRLRVAPAVFVVQQLRGSSGVGAFRTVAGGMAAGNPAERAARPVRPAARPAAETPRAGGADDTRGKRWIVLTGLVPIEKQEAAYTEAFRQSPGYDPQADYPTYLGYWVERVEATGSGDAPDWTKAKTIISSKAIREAEQEWGAGKDVEIVAPEYLDKTLVFPLPPLVNRVWDADVAHPEIPVLRANERGGGMGGILGPLGDRPRGGRMLGDERGAGMLGPMPGRPGGERGGREVNVDGTPFGDDPGAGREQPDQTAADAQENKAPAYKLFRFFDFNVEPGKQYVYRVRLALQNPNYGQKPANLANPELGAKKLLETKNSDPSPAISVLGDTRVLLVSVKPTRGGEPTGEIIMTKWVLRKGVEVFKEFPPPSIVRGLVLNFSEQVAKTIGAAPGGAAGRMAAPMGPMGLMGPMGAADRGRTGEKPPPLFAPTTAAGQLRVTFNSEATVVDLRGGERLPGRKKSDLTAGGDILILNADGHLVLHNELDDKPICEPLLAAAAEAAPRQPAGGRREMELPGPGRPGMGFDMLQPDKASKKDDRATKKRAPR